MYQLPGSSLFITDNKTIVNSSGESCNSIQKLNNQILIEMFGEFRWVDLDWLYAASIYKQMTKETIDLVEFYALPDLKTKQDKLGFFVSFKYPVYCGASRRYRIVPRYTNIACDREGNFITYPGFKPLIPYISDGYPMLSITDLALNRAANVMCHRLVAMAWIKNPSPYHNVVVNHINGIRSDNRVENLEWCTYKENSIHAVSHDLIKQNVRCRLRNVHTGEIKTFPSLELAFTFMGMKLPETIRIKKTRPNYLYQKTWEIRLDGDSRPWFYDNPNVQNIERSRYIITVTEPDGNVRVFNGTRLFKKEYQLWNIANNLSNMLRVFKERYPKYKVSYKDQQPPIEIQVRNIATGEVRSFFNQREAAGITGVDRTSLVKAARFKGKKEMKGYQIRYRSTLPWPEVTHHRENTPVSLVVIDRTTNKETIYPSLREVAAALEISRHKVHRLLNHGKSTDRYIVKLRT